VEKRLRLQIKSLEKQQQQKQQLLLPAADRGADVTEPSVAAAAAAADAAEAAAAELLAAEEEAAAAAAGKAAKKAAKKQRQAAAKAAAVADEGGTAADRDGLAGSLAACSIRPKNEEPVNIDGEQPGGNGSSSRAILATGVANELSEEHRNAHSTVGGALSTTRTPGGPSSEGTTAAVAAVGPSHRQHVQQTNDHGPCTNTSTSSTSLGQQQQQCQLLQAPATASGLGLLGATETILAPAAGTPYGPRAPLVVPAAVPVGRHGPGRSSSSSNVAGPWLAAVSRDIGGPGPTLALGAGSAGPSSRAATPSPLPGVAGLFWELSERRNPGRATTASPLPPPLDTSVQGVAGSGPGNSSSSSWQPQQPVTSLGVGGMAVPAAVAQPAAGRTATSSNGPGWVAPVGSVHTSSTAPSTAVVPARPPAAGSPVPGVQQVSPGRTSVVHRAIKPHKECVVCMEARSCVLQAPCGHLCCCEACMKLLRGRSEECFICRTQVTDYWVL
jgi:hypothetical protein